MSDLVEEALKFFEDHPSVFVKEKAVEESPIVESLHEDSKAEAKAPEENKEGA